ncbi:MAG: glycosyltransferase, partial [Patescibacteria group bacterium]
FGVFIALVSLFFHPRSIFVSLAPFSISVIKILSYVAPWMLKRVIVNEDTYPSLYYGGGHVTHASIEDVKKWYPKARAVIGVSRSTYADLKNDFKIPSPPLMYIPNWVSSGQRLNSKKRRNIDILYAGRLAKQKQPTILAGVLSFVLKKYPGIVVQIYADGPMKNEFISELSRLNIFDKVIFSTPVFGIDAILRKTKCLLFTSEFEGMPNIGLEAMSHGAVIAGLDVPGLRDIVDDGESGILAKDAKALSHKVIQLLRNPKTRDRLAKNAKKRVQSEFSEKNRDKFASLLVRDNS